MEKLPHKSAVCPHSACAILLGMFCFCTMSLLTAVATTADSLVLTGLVSAALYPPNVVIRSDAGHTYVRMTDGSQIPRVGDLVIARGHLKTDDNRQTLYYCDHVEKLGSKPVPPPVETTIESILDNRHTFQNVTVTGEIVDSFLDEIDPRFRHLVLRSGPSALYISVYTAGESTLKCEALIGAHVRITGVSLPSHGGRRAIVGPQLQLIGEHLIKILKPAPDIDKVPLLEDLHHVSPARINELGLRRIEGVVKARWRHNTVMAATDDGRTVVVECVNADALPEVGARVMAVGFPSTDLFHIQLSNAILRELDTARNVPQEAATQLTAQELFTDGKGTTKLKVIHHGECILVRGTVLTGPTAGALQLDVDNSGYCLTVDASACPDALAGIEPGCRLGVTGICIAETETWKSFHRYPRVHGFLLVPRTPSDVTVLSHPPWWTPARALYAFVVLVSLIVLAFLRNRRLLSIKVAERTMLAVELHDTLSQNLAAVSMQIATTRGGIDGPRERLAELLRTAERMVDSCRVELRHCLFDLRNRALDETDLNKIVRRALPQAGFDARLSVDIEIGHARLSDSLVRDVLCILRELALNAVRHGHATEVAIRGFRVKSHLHLIVDDNGTGFDPQSCPGPLDGHFGLTGIRERIKRLDGKFVISARAPSSGMRAEATIPIPRNLIWQRTRAR